MTHSTHAPLVSVILPVYNAEQYVSAAIESILAQTLQDFELIIIDDASTDNSWDIISQFQQEYSQKITAIRLDTNHNKGGDEAGNIAFAHARGRFVARMDADDIALPHRLATQVAYLKAHPEIGVVGSSATVINATGSIIGEKRTITDSKAIYRNYFTFHPLIHPTVMLRRAVIPPEKKLYRIQFPTNNDYFTFFSLINEGVQFANITEPLLYYRMHGKNDSLRNVKKTFLNTMKIRWQIMRQYHYQPTLLALMLCLMQIMVISVLPEAVVFQLYLLMRGIKTPVEVIRNILPTKLIAAYAVKE